MDEPFIKEEKSFCARALNLGLLSTVILTIAFGVYARFYVKNILALTGITLLYIISSLFTANKFIVKLNANDSDYNVKSKLVTLGVIIGICSFLVCTILFFPKEYVIVILTQNTLMDIILLITKEKLDKLTFDFIEFLQKLVGVLVIAIFGILLIACFVFTNTPLLYYVFINIICLCIVQI